MDDKLILRYAPRVEAGAKLLDFRRIGWYRDINMELLDIQHTGDCILGQLGGYMFMADKLFGDDSHEPLWKHGFDFSDDEYEEEEGCMPFDMLTHLWRKEITDRLRGDDSCEEVQWDDAECCDEGDCGCMD